MSKRNVDVLVIGGGQAGIPLAWALAGAGKRVALAERRHLGGSCVNFGCTPTKAAFASARVAHLARRSQEYGLRIPTVEVDFPAVLKRAREIALLSRNGLDQGFVGSDNPALLRGHARIEGRDGEGIQVRVGEELVIAGEVVLNTGTRGLIPPTEGLDAVDFIDAGSWLDRTELPAHLAIIGGGYIGLEMSQFYRRMGSRVTVVNRSRQVVGREDADVAEALRGLLEAEGVGFTTETAVTRVRATAGGVVLTLSGSGKSEELEATHVFVAAGRKPNTDDLGLETIGVKASPDGFVEVNERLQTSADGVWAGGDIRGGAMFTHTSWDDYRVLLSQMTGDGSNTTRRVIGYAIFTDPELGRVGMTEAEAREAGLNPKVARFEMSRSGKATEIGETKGFIKVVADGDSGEILGAAVLAVEGAELAHLYIDLMNAGAPYTVMRDAVHIHPTLAEAVQSAVTLLG